MIDLIALGSAAGGTVTALMVAKLVAKTQGWIINKAKRKTIEIGEIAMQAIEERIASAMQRAQVKVQAEAEGVSRIAEVEKERDDFAERVRVLSGQVQALAGQRDQLLHALEAVVGPTPEPEAPAEPFHDRIGN